MAQTPQLACRAPQNPEAFGKLCVRLAVRDGRIVATDTAFWMPAAFTPRSIEQAESELRTQLNGLLSGLPEPYVAALAPGEKDESLTDAATNTMRTFNGSIGDYAGPMQTWSDSNPNRLQPADVLTDGSNFFAPVVGSMKTLTLIYDQQLSSLDRSLAIFRFPNPFQSATVILQLPNTTSPAQQARIRSLRKMLAPLDGTLWDGAAIVEKLQSYYQRLGLNAQIATLPSGDNTVMISEGARIALIIMPEPDVTDYDVDKILWIVLSQRDFNTAMKHRPALADGVRTVDYDRDLGYHPGDEPYALAGRLQDQQTLLSEIGFVASVIPDSTRSGTTQPYQDLRIQKPATPAPADSTAPKPETPSVDPHGQVSTTTGTPAKPQSPDAKPAKPDKDKPWYIGGGFKYRPGQALSVFGLLQRSRVKFPFENGSFSGQLGYPSSGVRSLNYSADYLNFERFHQRLSVRLNGSTDVNQHRFLLGNKLDERRTGGFGQLMWEPFHDLDGALLQVTTEVWRATVTLSSNTVTASKINLSTLRIGALYLYRSSLSEHPRSLKIEPFIEAGLGFAATEKPFGLGGINANYHQTLGAIAPDITAHFAEASRATPLVELPSFGGAEVVRGFRADDAIGRRVLSLQNELSVPLLPASAQKPNPNKIEAIISQLRLAPFFDFGGAYQTLGSTPGFRTGAGLGLRLAMDKIVFKLDWAYGFGSAATGGSRGKFYFSVVSNLPF